MINPDNNMDPDDDNEVMDEDIEEAIEQAAKDISNQDNDNKRERSQDEESQGRQKLTRTRHEMTESPEVSGEESEDEPTDRKVMNSTAKEGAPNIRKSKSMTSHQESPSQEKPIKFNVPETPALRLQPSGSKHVASHHKIPETPANENLNQNYAESQMEESYCNRKQTNTAGSVLPARANKYDDDEIIHELVNDSKNREDNNE